MDGEGGWERRFKSREFLFFRIPIPAPTMAEKQNLKFHQQLLKREKVRLNFSLVLLKLDLKVQVYSPFYTDKYLNYKNSSNDTICPISVLHSDSKILSKYKPLLGFLCCMNDHG